MDTVRQICWTFGAVLIVSLVGGSWQDELSENSVSSPIGAPMPPLAIISDGPMSLAKSMSKVPLFPVPQKDLVLMKNVEITAISPDNTLVRCFNERTGLTEAMPAVKMILRSPVLLQPGFEQVAVDFPSFVNVIHRGSLVPLPIGALIAPISYQQLSQPILIKTVYAVPTFPLNYQYTPSLATTAYSRPLPPPHLIQPYPMTYNLFNHYIPPYINYRPINALPPGANAAKPLPSPMMTSLQPAVAPVPATIKQPSTAYAQNAPNAAGQQLVTVLDFPEAVASPSVLYYQPPISSDTEFENREPPQPVIPAGIVQSTQPQTSQQLFMNSKESVYLLSIKDDTKRS